MTRRNPRKFCEASPKKENKERISMEFSSSAYLSVADVADSHGKNFSLCGQKNKIFTSLSENEINFLTEVHDQTKSNP